MDRKKKTLREMTPAEIDEYIASRKAWRDLSEVERGERTEQDRARNYREGYRDAWPDAVSMAYALIASGVTIEEANAELQEYWRGTVARWAEELDIDPRGDWRTVPAILNIDQPEGSAPPVIIHDNGDIDINTGGWPSVMIHWAINALLPFGRVEKHWTGPYSELAIDGTGPSDPQRGRYSWTFQSTVTLQKDGKLYRVSTDLGVHQTIKPTRYSTIRVPVADDDTDGE
jgi:hypothetical protein